MYGRPYDIGQLQERAYSACTQDNAADVSHDDESARISSHVYRAAVEMGELNPNSSVQSQLPKSLVGLERIRQY